MYRDEPAYLVSDAPRSAGGRRRSAPRPASPAELEEPRRPAPANPADREPSRPADPRHRPVDLGCEREPDLGQRSWRTAQVARQFGLPTFAQPITVVEPARVTLAPGKVVAIVGPSGSGKSTVLAQIERAFPGGCMVQRVTFPAEAAIVDAIARSAPLGDALTLLSACALGEPRLWLRRYSELSDGERFRAQLARALGLRWRTKSFAPLLCDEFGSILHRRAAKAVAFNLQKLARRHGLTVIVAASNDDILPDLQPDTLVRLPGLGRCTVEQRTPQPRRLPSFARQLVIEPGSKSDYDDFAPMHYRATDELGFVDKVFVLRERRTGVALGIVVYAFSPLELALRNQATNRRFLRNARRLNRSMRILRRLVIHPDIRGCGLGYLLVRRTLPLVGTRFVECLAAMGEVNPVFERAGMQRIGQCAVPAKRRAALATLADLDVDPHGRDFVRHVCRRPRVRRIVADMVGDWYSASTSTGTQRAQRQSPHTLAQTFRSLVGAQPVYYLWQRPTTAKSTQRPPPSPSRRPQGQTAPHTPHRAPTALDLTTTPAPPTTPLPPARRDRPPAVPAGTRLRGARYPAQRTDQRPTRPRGTSCHALAPYCYSRDNGSPGRALDGGQARRRQHPTKAPNARRASVVGSGVRAIAPLSSQTSNSIVAPVLSNSIQLPVATSVSSSSS